MVYDLGALDEEYKEIGVITKQDLKKKMENYDIKKTGFKAMFSIGTMISKDVNLLVVFRNGLRAFLEIKM